MMMMPPSMTTARDKKINKFKNDELVVGALFFLLIFL